MQSPYSDVVYLKNGSIIKGIILEQIPNQSLKIQTADGSVFVYQMFEVERITKDIPPTQPPKLGIMRRRGRDLWLDNRELSGKEVMEMVGKVDYSTFCRARRQLGWGRAFTAIFFSLLGIAIFLAIVFFSGGADEDIGIAAYIIGLVANVFLVLMIVLKSAGKGRINWVANQYNKFNHLS